MCFNNKTVIYNSYMDVIKRGIITGRRPLNHRLKIELARYQRPVIPRDQRICELCEELEGEVRVVSKCPIYDDTRANYGSLLERNNEIKIFLNPPIVNAVETANLHDIEKFLLS